MIGWALTFLIVALVGGVLGFSGTAANIAWVLFLVGIVLAIVFGIAGRRRAL